LERRPGLDWNFERLFRSQTPRVRSDTVPGFGDHVFVEGLTVVDGTLAVPRAREPPGADPWGGLVPAEDEWIVPAPGGRQSASFFYRLTAYRPHLHLADPGGAPPAVRIGALSTIALPFEPPAAVVRNLTGQLTLRGDTIGASG